MIEAGNVKAVSLRAELQWFIKTWFENVKASYGGDMAALVKLAVKAIPASN